MSESEAVEFLKSLGYGIAEPNKSWETPAQFNRRLGVCKEAIRRALKRPDCPSVTLHRKEKRIMQICSNALFDQFVLTNKK